MMLSTPAPHAPFTPAPQHANAFNHKLAPRNGSYNIHGKGKHWLVRVAPNPMSPISINVSDSIFRNRWRTLLSVDDLVENLVTQLRHQKLLDNTFIFFSSDNGFHSGQFSLPNDKRQMYEFDIRVPLLVRGPGIMPQQISNSPVLTIDFAPTFLDIAGIKPPHFMDGQSMLPFLQSNYSRYKAQRRRHFLIEYNGEGRRKVKNCPQYDNQYLANCYPDCVCEDAWNNTYRCVRTLTDRTDFKYCRFHDRENFTEAYDFTKDPEEFNNVAGDISPRVTRYYDDLLEKLEVCKTESCERLGRMKLPTLDIGAHYPHNTGGETGIWTTICTKFTNILRLLNLFLLLL